MTNVFEQLQIRAEDIFRVAAYEEFFGNHLFESQDQDYYEFSSDHLGDTLWLVGKPPEYNEYEILRIKDANKHQIIPQPCPFYHCEPIDRTWLEDKRVQDIEVKIRGGGKLLAQKINKAFVDVLLLSISERVKIHNHQLDELIADVFSTLVKKGFHPDRFIFPEHLEAKFVRQGLIIRDKDIQNHHYVGKTITGQQAYSSKDLPTGLVLLLDSEIGTVLLKNPRFSAEKLKALTYGVCGYYATNLIIKNTHGIVAIEGIDEMPPKKPDNISTLTLSSTQYVDSARLLELREITSKEFDLSKLIQLCDELNKCYANECYLAVTMLIRAILDHVPPIFGYKTFLEVSNNYGGKSLKKSLQTLQNTSRNIADNYLHLPIRDKESLPNKTQVNFANDLDVLLAEIVRLLK